MGSEMCIRDRGYCRPEITLGREITIENGRHPVVEAMLKDSLFVPNDTHLGAEDNQVSIITGPNMAGKSTYMRQNALIALMAQIGSFVPARECHVGVVDAIFTRIGASDDLAAGQSTFMVEMTEVAEILKNATPKSLVVLDEIGRGTSTFDGMSIARAVVEHISDPAKGLGCKTLFATHYHELTELEGGGLEHIVKQLGYGDDPLNQRASVGWKAIKTAERLCEQYMVRIESISPKYSAKAKAN